MKKRTFILRWTALCLALLMIAMGLMACGEDPVEPDPIETEGTEETDTEADTEAEQTESDETEASDGITLCAGGTNFYNIVLPKKPTEAEKEIATKLATCIKAYSGTAPDITYDDVTPHKESAYNILIGATSYPETEQVMSELGFGEYAVCVVGNKLVVAGHLASTLARAGELLLNKVLYSGSQADKSVVLRVGDDWRGTEDQFLLDFPRFTDGNLNVDLDNENKTMMLGYKGVKVEEFSAYCGAMEKAGYKVWQQNQIGENHFLTYRRGTDEIHLSFYPKGTNGTLHIFTDPHTETAPIPDADPNYEKVTEATLHVMSLDYTHRNWDDGHGMCYVITLEDGRYIVMDGGYSSSSGSKDDEKIYNYLVEHNKRKDGKVVIAAWFMSHPHGDHFGAFGSFVPKYKDQVTIEYFIANPYSPSMADGTHWMLTSLPGLLAQTNTKLIKPHTGQVITFCNTKLEVIYTHENLYPNKLSDTNNSSTVLRMHQNGHTVIFTGDASVAACNKMVSLYGDALKSDMFQVNHHGCSGGTWELYDTATREDSIVLWTCAEEAFYYRTYGQKLERTIASDDILKPNRDLALKVGWNNNLYADGVVEQITFPKDGAIQISEERDYAVDPTTLPEPEPWDPSKKNQ